MNFEDRRKLSNIGNAIIRLLVKFMTWKEKIGHSVTSGVHKIKTSQTVFGEEVRRKLVFKSHTRQHSTSSTQKYDLNIKTPPEQTISLLLQNIYGGITY